jgi:cell division protein FtsI/penicillin-binding protein 2
MTRRQLLLALVLLAGFALIGFRLFRLQVLQGDLYIRAAQANRRERLDTPAPRGAILDRYGRAMTTTLPRYDVTYFIPDHPVRDHPWIPSLRASP